MALSTRLRSLLGPVPGVNLLFPGRVPQIVGAPDAVAETVRIADGLLVGRASGQGRVFLGIPYAAPPVAGLRWRAPRPVVPWTRPREAWVPGWPAAQLVGMLRPDRPSLGLSAGSEDCLYLNVYTPSESPPADGWPVLVFLHGGGFIAGSGDNYDPTRLAASQRLVVVTANYRLGIFGFFAHPVLRREEPAGSGNFGLLDQQAALRWVSRNIRAFGGNPSNVTLCGESAGAWSVSYHLLSPGSRGLFHRAILQSGTATDILSLVPAAEADAAGTALVTAAAPGTPEQLDWLRRQPAAGLVRLMSPRRGIFGRGSWGPVWGDPVIPEHPIAAFDASHHARMPLMAGTNREEGRLFALLVQGQRSYEARLRQDFGPWQALVTRHHDRPGPYRQRYAQAITDGRFAWPAERLRRACAGAMPVFAYEFAEAHPPVNLPMGRIPGAFHAAELVFLFGTRWLLANPDRFTEPQAALSAQMMAAWGNFARSGAPGWSAYTADDPAVMTLSSDGGGLSRDFAARHDWDFWQALAGGPPSGEDSVIGSDHRDLV